MVDKKEPLVLIVEDELIITLDLKRELKLMGLKAIAVKSGEEALEIVSDICPDLIIMDITLKGKLDGLTASVLIDQLDIPIIIISAQPEQRLEELLHGMPCEYLAKPFDPRKLKEKIFRILKIDTSDLFQ